MRTCAICGHTLRKAIEEALASEEHSRPRHIARLFPAFSRAQIRRHRDWCLGRIPRVMDGLLRVGMSEEAVAQQLREEGRSEASIEATLAVARRLIAAKSEAS